MCTLWLRNFVSGHLFYKWICTTGEVKCIECSFEAATENNKRAMGKGLSKLGHNQTIEYNAAVRRCASFLNHMKRFLTFIKCKSKLQKMGEK